MNDLRYKNLICELALENVFAGYSIDEFKKLGVEPTHAGLYDYLVGFQSLPENIHNLFINAEYENYDLDVALSTEFYKAQTALELFIRFHRENPSLLEEKI